MNTLRQIWEINQQNLPFAARLKSWTKDTYVVVFKYGAWYDRKKMPEGVYLDNCPVGVCLTNGVPNNVFSKEPLYSNHFVIPFYDSAYWEMIVGLDLSRFERRRIYSLENYIQFGKYTGWNVKDLINYDLKYITWIAKEAEHYTFDKLTLDYIGENFPNFDRGVLRIAEEKESLILQFFESPAEWEDFSPLTSHPEILTLPSKNWDKVDDGPLKVNRRDEIENEDAFKQNANQIKQILVKSPTNKQLSQNRINTITNPYINDSLKWSTSDDVQLKGLHANGRSIDQIASILRRKPNSVRKRIKYLDLRRV